MGFYYFFGVFCRRKIIWQPRNARSKQFPIPGEFTMSESFFKFIIRCPKCGDKQFNADGFETDDWSEVFVFSGYSRNSAGFHYNSYYTCPSCSEKTEIDFLYQGHFIEPESIERVIEYLEDQLPNVVEKGRIYNHGWSPDLDIVLYRYCLLYPANRRLEKLKDLYFNAIHNPSFFTKFEPAYGTSIVSADMIPYRELLKKIYFPDTVTIVSDNAFLETGISDLFLPRNVTSVGKCAFKGCYHLSTVHSSNSLTKIGDYAFCDTKIRKFFFPDGINEIGKHAFENTLLSEVYIPPGCMMIGEGAFSNCISLKKVTIPLKFKEVEKLFEPSAELYYSNSPNEVGTYVNLCDLRFDYISCGYDAEKKYDLMIYFTGSRLIDRSVQNNSLNSTMSNSCLSICEELINNSCIPIGEFRLMHEPRITITNQLMIVKTPNLREWKKDGNFEKIKEIYANIINYAADNNYRTLSFPLWQQEWNFHYYSELLSKR